MFKLGLFCEFILFISNYLYYRCHFQVGFLTLVLGSSFGSVGVIANKTHVVCLETEPSAPWQRDVLLPNLYPYGDLLHSIINDNVSLSN